MSAKPLTLPAILALCAGLAGCGPAADSGAGTSVLAGEERRTSTFGDLFVGTDDPNVTLEVNRYIWVAAQEVLSFLPIEEADPFSGILVMGYGVPPGGGRAYSATVYVQDPALEARSLRVAVQSRGGAVARETARQVEDAILTRARQLRIADANL